MGQYPSSWRQKWNEYKQNFDVVLAGKEQISHDSYLFKFEFQDPNQKLDIAASSHIKLFASGLRPWPTFREYTPIAEGPGYFLVPIKIYRPNYNSDNSKGGLLTPWLEQLSIGSKLQMQRTYGNLYYENGLITLLSKRSDVQHKFNNIFMICGGSGLNPAYQLIKKICDNEQDQTKLFLLYANKTEQDIWYKTELDNLAKRFPNKFQVNYTISKPTSQWKGFVGHINEQMINQAFPKPDEKTMGLVCGPGKFNRTMAGILSKIGIKNDFIIQY